MPVVDVHISQLKAAGLKQVFQSRSTEIVTCTGQHIDYDDLHTAMREVYSKYQGDIEKQTEDDVTEKLKLLRVDLERANNDREFAKKFLSRLRI